MSGARHATPDDWATLLTEFASDPPEFLQVWLDATADAINISWWKRKACVAHVFLAAHMLTVVNPGAGSGSGGELGPVNEKRIDKLTVKYAAVGAATGLDAHFATTKYGRNYLTLRSTLLVLPIVGRRTLAVVPEVC